MSSNFYNDKYTLITKEKVKHELPPNIENFYGSFNKAYFNIKSYELENDEFFNGHIIVNGINTNIDFETIQGNKLTRYNIFFDNVEYYPKESVSNKIIYCSSWVLPFLYGIEHTPKKLYTQCFMHRLDILCLTNKNTSVI